MVVVTPSLPPDLESEVSAFLDHSRHCPPSQPLSLATVKLCRRLVGQAPWGEDAGELRDLLRRRVGQRCMDDPGQAVVGNLVRRVLKLLREEHSSIVSASASGREHEEQQQEETGGLHKMLQSQESARSGTGGEQDHGLDKADRDLSRPAPGLKAKLLESVEELELELENAPDEISNQALEHIHANEVILTVGRSHTVEQFLKAAAAKKRSFQVIVAECGPPGFGGQEMAVSLAKEGIQTTVITDSAVFAMMSRVNKVIVGTAAILADGGLKAPSGTYTAALSARHYSVPLYVCASIAKLTPRYCTSNDLVAFNKFSSPEGSMVGLEGKMLSSATASTPVYEYVPPDLVTLLISNLSGHAPSYVYRLLSELYHPNDYDLAA